MLVCFGVLVVCDSFGLLWLLFGICVCVLICGFVRGLVVVGGLVCCGFRLIVCLWWVGITSVLLLVGSFVAFGCFDFAFRYFLVSFVVVVF